MIINQARNVRVVASYFVEVIPIIKTTDEKIKRRCEEFGMIFVGAQRGSGKAVVLFQCPTHNYKGVQSKSWYDFNHSKHGCSLCSGKGWSTEDFKLHLSNINPDIEVLGEYTGDSARIECRCRKCDRVWYPTAHDLKRGSGCAPCSFKEMGLRERNSKEKMQQKIWNVQPNVNLIGEYRTIHKNVRCRCSVCDTEWEAMPSNLMRLNTGCPTCRQEELIQKLRWSQEEVDEMLSKQRPDVILKSPYTTYHEKMLCYCAEHDNTYWQSLPQLLDGHRGCTMCQNKSVGEMRVCDVLNRIGVSYKTQYSFDDCTHINKLWFDFYLPDYNVAIEYDGEGHYVPIDFAGKGKQWAEEQFQLGRKRDAIKDDYCRKNNIELIRIPYFEYDNIDAILCNRLESRINAKCIS